MDRVCVSHWLLRASATLKHLKCSEGIQGPPQTKHVRHERIGINNSLCRESSNQSTNKFQVGRFGGRYFKFRFRIDKRTKWEIDDGFKHFGFPIINSKCITLKNRGEIEIFKKG